MSFWSNNPHPMMRLHGKPVVGAIDISRHQGAWHNPQATENSGIRFLYLRGLNGLRVDDRSAQYIEQAKAQNLPFGLYIYVRPSIDAHAQAEAIVKLTEQHGADLLPMLDIEAHDGLGRDKVTEHAIQVIQHVEHLTKRPAVLYSAAWFWDRYLLPGRMIEALGSLSTRFRWVARYVGKDTIETDVRQWPHYINGKDKQPRMPQGWTTWDAWQFSADGNAMANAMGFSSHSIDLNVVDATQLGKIWRGAASSSADLADHPDATADPEVGSGDTETSGADATTMPPRIRRGSKRAGTVKMLQRMLQSLGHRPGPIDGIFGKQTEAAVRRFQTAAGITVDGIVGQKETWPALMAATKEPS